MEPTLWQMPLKSPPRLVQAGRAVHGRFKREEFLLPQLWCLCLFNYHGQMRIAGHDFEIRPGWAGVIPPNSRMVFRFHGESRHTFAHFELPAGEERVPMPAMQDLGKEYGEVARALDEAAGWLPSMPCRASVRLWDVLWQLAGCSGVAPAPERRLHPALRKAVEDIEVRLAEPLSIPRIAARAAVSHNHLTRLFKAEFGLTTEGYIRKRRVERASHLLAHTTMSIKSIATEVGLSDLHYFNKTMRGETGMGPRAYRNRKAAEPAAE